MSRLSIDLTPEQHQKIKAVAAMQGKSIKEYVLAQIRAFKQTTPKSHRIFFNTTADVALNQIRASQF
jgi:uncharacterized protein (DUF1778 family)